MNPVLGTMQNGVRNFGSERNAIMKHHRVLYCYYSIGNSMTGVCTTRYIICSIHMYNGFADKKLIGCQATD